VHHYAAASEVRGLSHMLESLQAEAGRIIARLPSRRHGRIADDAVWGDLGLQDASAAQVQGALRLFKRVRGAAAPPAGPRFPPLRAGGGGGGTRGNWISWLRSASVHWSPEYEAGAGRRR
jgi:hypothetical protein